MLADCVESIKLAGKRLLPARIKIIIWDNASTDCSLEMIRETQDVVVLRSDRNLGFGVACNRALANTRADYFFLINPDLRLDPAAAESAFRFLEDDQLQEYGACGVVLFDSNGTRTRTCVRLPTFVELLAAGFSEHLAFLPNHRMHKWDHCSSRDVPHVIGACMLIRRWVFSELGGFDDSYPLYLEDLDFSARLGFAGLKIRFIDVGTTIHIGGGVSRKVLVHRTALSLAARVIYARKHFGQSRALLLDLWMRVIEIPIRIIYLLKNRTSSTLLLPECYNQALRGKIGIEPRINDQKRV